MPTIENLCVYCGSSDKVDGRYLDAARQTGEAIAARGMTLVYGAGGTGLMGALAQAALGAGGRVIGVIPEMFNTPTLLQQGLTELHIMPDMHARKKKMIDLSDAFIALPGGFGTIEELFEVLTWSQIGLHRLPVGLLNTDGYFDPLQAWISQAGREGFIYREHLRLLIQDEQPEALIDRLGLYQPPEGLQRWVTREEL